MKQRRCLACILSLFIGAICIALSHEAFKSIAAPELFLQLVPYEKRIAVRFINLGSQVLTLDFANLECFLYIPYPDRGKYYIQLRVGFDKSLLNHMNVPQSKAIKLHPGEHVDIGNVYPLLVGLPPEEVLLYATYSAAEDPASPKEYWRGVAISLPLVLELTKN